MNLFGHDSVIVAVFVVTMATGQQVNKLLGSFR
jgi:hypothetical protein